MLGTADYGGEFVSAVARGAGLRRPVPPREVGPGRAARCCGTSCACVRARGPGMILLPAVDIRDGRAVRLRQGDFDDETVYADDPLEAARSFVEAGRALPARGGPGRRARRGSRRTSDHLGRITHELDVPVQYGGGLRSLERGAGGAGGRARTGWCWARPPTPTRSCSTRRSRRGARRVLVAVDVRGGQVSVAGWTEETQMRRRGRDRAAAARAARRASSTPTWTATGCSRGPTWTRSARVAGGPRALPLLGRDRVDRRPRGAARGCGCGTWPG